jgi:hypothetical protein
VTGEAGFVMLVTLVSFASPLQRTEGPVNYISQSMSSVQ